MLTFHNVCFSHGNLWGIELRISLNYRRHFYKPTYFHIALEIELKMHFPCFRVCCIAIKFIEEHHVWIAIFWSEKEGAEFTAFLLSNIWNFWRSYSYCIKRSMYEIHEELIHVHMHLHKQTHILILKTSLVVVIGSLNLLLYHKT